MARPLHQSRADGDQFWTARTQPGGWTSKHPAAAAVADRGKPIIDVYHGEMRFRMDAHVRQAVMDTTRGAPRRRCGSA